MQSSCFLGKKIPKQVRMCRGQGSLCLCGEGRRMFWKELDLPFMRIIGPNPQTRALPANSLAGHVLERLGHAGLEGRPWLLQTQIQG